MEMLGLGIIIGLTVGVVLAIVCVCICFRGERADDKDCREGDEYSQSCDSDEYYEWCENEDRKG